MSPRHRAAAATGTTSRRCGAAQISTRQRRRGTGLAFEGEERGTPSKVRPCPVLVVKGGSAGAARICHRGDRRDLALPDQRDGLSLDDVSASLAATFRAHTQAGARAHRLPVDDGRAPLLVLPARVRVLRPRVLSNYMDFSCTSAAGPRQLGGMAVSALSPAMRVVRAGLLTVASALVKPRRVMSTRGGSTRWSSVQPAAMCACGAAAKWSHESKFDS